MIDITALILDDHETFRRRFAMLDDATTPDESQAIWSSLADLLDVHAAAEELIFYPELLQIGDPQGSETEDAISDHNDIRDAVARAEEADVGTSEWWGAVGDARRANSDHMAEEEREGLRSFRQKAGEALRGRLGVEFLTYKHDHPTRGTIDTVDKDPETFIEHHARST